MDDSRVKCGIRVKISPVSTVCEYLHGSIGVVVHPCASKDFVARGSQSVAVNVHRVRLEKPVAPTKDWSPIEVIGLRAEQMEEEP